MTLPTPIEAIALNDPAATDNRIHEDGVARRLGFSGALVPGVTVYGLLARQAVAGLGADWLAHGSGHVRFLKPAYHGDRLTLTASAGPDGTGLLVEAHGPDGNLLAPLTASTTDLPAPDPDWAAPPAPGNPARAEIAWDDLVPGTRLAAQWFRPTLTESLARAWVTADDNPLYRPAADHPNPPLHPLVVATLWNKAFTLRWVMPTWIHVETRFWNRGPLRVGDTIELRTRIEERFERKGHQFARLHLGLLVDGALRHEAQHTAITRPAGI